MKRPVLLQENARVPLKILVSNAQQIRKRFALSVAGKAGKEKYGRVKEETAQADAEKRLWHVRMMPQSKAAC
jgi:hypothetical protein